jgi:hypothetical protein
MYSQHSQESAVVAREASLALMEFKTMVDSTAERVRAAERQAIGMAIGRREEDDALTMIRAAAEALQSADFDAALCRARAKTQVALARLSAGRAQ